MKETDQGSDISEQSGRSGRSSRSGNSRGSLPAMDAGRVRLIPPMCRRIFQISKYPSLDLVCLNSTPCSRPYHREGERCEAIGSWVETVKSSSRFSDGRLDTLMDPADYAQAQAALASENEAAYQAANPAGLWDTMKQKLSGLSTPADKKEPLGGAHFEARLPAEGPAVRFQSMADHAPERSEMDTKPAARTGPVKRSPPITVSTVTSRDSEEEARHMDMQRELEAARTEARLLQEQLARTQRSHVASYPGIPGDPQQSPGSPIPPLNFAGDPRRREESAPKVDRARLPSPKGSKRSKKDRKKRKKKNSRKRDPSPSSSSSSSSSSSESLGSSDSSRATSDRSGRGKKTPRWYAVLGTEEEGVGVYSSVRKAQRRHGRHCPIKKVRSQALGWQAIQRHLAQGSSNPSETTANSDPEERPAPRNVAPPPRTLQGRDKSTGNEKELFGISLEQDSQGLRDALAPPEVDAKDRKELGNRMIDALSLPGKHHVSDPYDETMAQFGESMMSLAVVARQENLGENQRHDFKWHHASQTVFKTVKNEEDLADMIHDVRTLEESQLLMVETAQMTLLRRYLMPESIMEAWCQRGYITTISRLSLTYYLGLLEYFRKIARIYTWEQVKVEIDYHYKKISLLRTADSRLMALCLIYCYLRDGAKAGWITLKLEHAKQNNIIKTIQELSGNGKGKNGGQSHCTRCGTALHSREAGCPWASLSNTKAQAAGKNALRNLAKWKTGPEEEKTDN